MSPTFISCTQLAGFFALGCNDGVNVRLAPRLRSDTECLPYPRGVADGWGAEAIVGLAGLGTDRALNTLRTDSNTFLRPKSPHMS